MKYCKHVMTQPHILDTASGHIHIIVQLLFVTRPKIKKQQAVQICYY